MNSRVEPFNHILKLVPQSSGFTNKSFFKPIEITEYTVD